MKIFTGLLIAGALTGLSAQAADAQLLAKYGTQGTFSGSGCTNMTNGLAMSTCTVGTGASAITLTYDRVLSETSGGNVSFGQFVTTGGTGLGSGFQLFQNIDFSLEVAQTAPSIGSQSLEAQITGRIRAAGGALEWAPVTPLAFMLGTVSYEVLVDDDGTDGISISTPFANGGASNPQTIRGSVRIADAVVSVPEPSSILLLVGGMAAMGMVARRRGSAA